MKKTKLLTKRIFHAIIHYIRQLIVERDTPSSPDWLLVNRSMSRDVIFALSGKLYILDHDFLTRVTFLRPCFFEQINRGLPICD